MRFAPQRREAAGAYDLGSAPRRLGTNAARFKNDPNVWARRDRRPRAAGHGPNGGGASGRLPPRDFRPEQRDFGRKRRSHARALAHALEIGLDVRMRRKVDLGRRLRPVQDSREITLRDAEALEQEFPTLQLVVEIGEARSIFLERPSL